MSRKQEDNEMVRTLRGGPAIETRRPTVMPRPRPDSFDREKFERTLAELNDWIDSLNSYEEAAAIDAWLCDDDMLERRAIAI
jgi:hypothetical protein